MASRLRHWLIGGLFALVAPLAPAKAASNPTDTLREAFCNRAGLHDGLESVLAVIVARDIRTLPCKMRNAVWT